MRAEHCPEELAHGRAANGDVNRAIWRFEEQTTEHIFPCAPCKARMTLVAELVVGGSRSIGI